MSLERKHDFEATALPGEKSDSSVGEVQDLSHDTEAEKKVLRKFDNFLLPPLAVILLVAYLDRSNLGNAKVFGFEAGKYESNEVHLSTPNQIPQASVLSETSSTRFRRCFIHSMFYSRFPGLWQSNVLVPTMSLVLP
jgi:hypothetical protein